MNKTGFNPRTVSEEDDVTVISDVRIPLTVLTDTEDGDIIITEE